MFFIKKIFLQTLFLTFITLVIFFQGLYFQASAQIGQGIGSSVGNVSPGSIISRDSRTGTFFLSRSVADPNVFGIIAGRPIANIRPEEEGGVSVMRTGKAKVNIVLVGRPIRIGDYITTSDVVGYGMLAENNHSYVVGIALESFREENAEIFVLNTSGEEVPSGQIMVDLKIGMREGDITLPGGGSVNPPGSLIGNHFEHYLAMIARYLAAALVALGALYLSFRFFKTNVGGGLSSIGRNPLARGSIQRMMLLNMLLVVLISVGGLLLSALILLVPIIINRMIP